MTKWQLSRLLVALLFLVVGLVFFAVFVYFGYFLFSPSPKTLESGHEMVFWLSLVYGFSAFLVTALMDFTLKSVIPSKLFLALLVPIIISGLFLVGIPLFQVLSNSIGNNA
jgi:hypothetical protein